MEKAPPAHLVRIEECAFDTVQNAQRNHAAAAAVKDARINLFEM